MPEKEPAFKVTDRRKFTAEGESRDTPPPEETAPPEAAVPGPQGAPAMPNMPPPTAAEQKAGAEAYRQAQSQLDSSLSGLGTADEFRMTFEMFLWNIYISGLVQLGAVPQQGGPEHEREVDLVGARHTIDTLAILEEKTKGNLSDKERELLQRILFELRMTFLDVMNALARQAKGPAPSAEGK